VMRTRWDNQQRFSDLLQSVKEHSLQAFQHQDVPFELLVDELNVVRDLSQTPLFNTMFVLQSSQQMQATNAVDGLEIKALINEKFQQTAKVDLTLKLVNSDQITMIMEYRTALFSAASIARMLQHYVQLLEQICVDSTQAIDKLSFISEDEKLRQII